MHPVQQFCVLWRLATAVEIAWMVQAGSNLDESPFHAHWAECIHVSWNWMVIFTVLVRQRWFYWTIFKMQSFCIKWMEKCQKPAQFVAHWWLIVLFFGSCQTDHWLPRYGCFKFWVVGMCRYVHVYVCMCMYHKVYAGICRYTNGCACSVCTLCPTSGNCVT